MRFVRRGYRQRLLTSTEGSFSARLDGDSFLITPYGIDRQTVDLGDLTLVQDGCREAGKQPSRAAPDPPGDLPPLRRRAGGRQRHPGQRHRIRRQRDTPLDTRTIPESYLFLRDVGVVPFGLQYEDGERIAALVSPERPVALIENDGVLVLGTSVLDAFDRLEVLESTAEAVINSRAIGQLHRMSDATIDELIDAFARPKKTT